MHDYDYQTIASSKPRLSEKTEAEYAHEPADQIGDAAQPDRLVPIRGRADSTASARAHAVTLNRTTMAHPARARQSLLQLQRQYGNGYVQRVVSIARQGTGPAEVTSETEEAIKQARGGGHSLDSSVRAQMEPAFDADFSNVRVHTGAQADQLSRALNARAFTTGQDIFFRQGTYNPGSASGRELVAHELTHVVQQNGDQVQPKLTVNQPGDRYEQEADQMAQAVIRQEQRSARPETPAGGLNRQAEEQAQMQSERAVQRQAEEEEEEMMTAQTKAEEAMLQRQAEEEEEETV